jgi:hypothetical protein
MGLADGARSASFQVGRTVEFGAFTKGIRDVLKDGLRPGAESPQPTTSRTRACDASSTGVTPKRRLNSRLNCDGLS